VSGSTVSVSSLPETAMAVQMDGYGEEEVLEARRVPLLALSAGEVRLRTLAAAVNRADIEIRSGKWPIERPDPFPYTPGLEVLGEVVEVAPGVGGVSVGQRAITMMQRLGGIHGERPGGYGEYVSVPAESVAVVPDDVDVLALAALGLAAVTALEGLRRIGIVPGARVAVLGASGGVGSAAVTLATGLGARVVGVLPNLDKADYVRGLGAADVVALDDGSMVDQLGARSLDGVFETLGARTFRDSVASLRRGGRLCLIGAVTGEHLDLIAWDLMQDLVLTGYSSENLTGDELRADIAHLCAELRAGRLRPPDYKVLPLSEAGDAHRRLERGEVSGRLLLVPG
jgi:NADPH2:quinone reductase